MPRERIQECIVEEIIEVTVSRVMEKIIEGVNPFHRSVCSITQERRSLTCQVHTFKKKTGWMTQLIPQKTFSDHVVEQTVDVSRPTYPGTKRWRCEVHPLKSVCRAKWHQWAQSSSSYGFDC